MMKWMMTTMTSKLWVYTGGRPSNGAKELSNQDGFKRCRTGKGIKLKDILINWGSSHDIDDLHNLPDVILNEPESVKIASNKLLFFQELEDGFAKTVEWTTSQQVAQGWLDDGRVVVVRNKLTGHSGDGIIIVDPSETNEVPPAPLYTKYIFKDKEFRVHVCLGKVIDTQQKIRDPNKEVVTWKVRSHANGFIFARNNVLENAARDTAAIAVIDKVGLDFGAVDIIQHKNQFYVLEVNTAPGLEGQTIESYAKAFKAFRDKYYEQ